MFYPDLKRYISPSAYQTWHKAKSGFVKSYFAGDRSGETKAMKTGKLVHSLIQAGLLEVTHRFSAHEVPIEVPLENGVAVMGIPDSRPADEDALLADGTLPFVDYKTGKENEWNDIDLAGDLKMKVTAWLIYQRAKGLGRSPTRLIGYIEYVPTKWDEDAHEIVPTGGVSVVAGHVIYSPEELESFTPMILKTIAEVNEAYETWLTSTDAFVNQDDVIEYARLDEEVREREARMEQLKERIGDQMKMGMKDTLPTVFGSFYYHTTKKYVYPDDLPVSVGSGKVIRLVEASVVEDAAAIVRKKYETDHEPESSTRTLRFRGKGAKNKKPTV
jgi:hypothetical protein